MDVNYFPFIAQRVTKLMELVRMLDPTLVTQERSHVIIFLTPFWILMQQSMPHMFKLKFSQSMEIGVMVST